MRLATSVVTAFFVACVFLLLNSSAYALHWGRGPFGGENGKRIHNALTAPAHHWGQGPFAGRNGAKIHSALMGAEKAVGGAATTVWRAVKRPFVETWKFVKDPLAGLRRKAQSIYSAVVRDATKIAYLVVKWLSVGFGASLVFAIAIAMGLTAFFFRERRFARAIR